MTDLANRRCCQAASAAQSHYKYTVHATLFTVNSQHPISKPEIRLRTMTSLRSGRIIRCGPRHHTSSAGPSLRNPQNGHRPRQPVGTANGTARQWIIQQLQAGALYVVHFIARRLPNVRYQINVQPAIDRAWNTGNVLLKTSRDVLMRTSARIWRASRDELIRTSTRVWRATRDELIRISTRVWRASRDEEEDEEDRYEISDGGEDDGFSDEDE